MILDKNKIQKVRENWQTASLNLNFKLITPHSILYNKEVKEVFAFLPDYGSINGMVVEIIFSPEYKFDKSVIELCKKNNFFYSFINVEDFLEYDEIYFKEVLDDWSRFSV